MCSARYLLLLTAALVIAIRPPHAKGDEADNLRAEAQLLHRSVRLDDLSAFSAGAWAPLRPLEVPVLVVHVWSTECSPCLEEMPRLLAAIRSYANEPRVRFLLVSESQDEARWRALLATAHADLPNVIHARSGGHLRAALRDGAQPMTLLLDERRVVRQAFRGSLLGRLASLSQSIDLLLRLARRPG